MHDCPPQVRAFVDQARRAGFRAPVAGGLADGLAASRFSPQALARGLCVELEHTRSWPQAMRIAMDHLVEHEGYYEGLARMEAQLQRNPWWRSRWALWSAVGAVMLGGVIVWARSRKGPLGPAPVCGETFDDVGGVVEDVAYVELRPGGIGPQTALPMVIVLADTDLPALAAGILGLPVPVRMIVPTERYGGSTWVTSPRGTTAHAEELADTAAALSTFVEQIPLCRPTRGRPVVAGYDGGADVAYALATEIPSALGGVVGAAGYPALQLGVIDAPTTAIHGRSDEVVPHAEVAAAVATMVGAGAPITWVPMAGVGHGLGGALEVRWLQAISQTVQDQVGR